MKNSKIYSAPMVVVAIVLIVGIMLSDLNVEVNALYYAFAALGVLALVLDAVLKKPLILLFSAILFGGFLLGLSAKIDNDDLNYENNLIYLCKVDSHPNIRGKWKQFDALLLTSRDSLLNYCDLNHKVVCNVDSSLNVGLGDTVILRGILRKLDGSYGKHLSRKGFSARLYGFDTFIKKSNENSLAEKLNSIQTVACDKIASLDSLKPQATAIMTQMVVGRKTNVSQDTIEDYRNIGAAHLLAISGLHIGIIVTLLNFIFGAIKLWNGKGKVIFSIVVILTLWAYALFSGLSVSVARAAIMFTLYQIALLCSRDGTKINVLATSAIVILLIDPMAIYDIGFQLSFAAMVGIDLFFRPLCSLWRPSSRFLWVLYSGFCVSLAAQVSVMPLIVFHFGNMPWAGVFLSVVIWLSVPLIIFSTIIYLLTSIGLIGAVGVIVADMQNELFGLLAGVDLFVVEDLEIDLWLLCMIYLTVLVFAIWFRRWTNKHSRRSIYRQKEM